MRAEDILVKAFPQVLACGETLPPGDLPIPWEHPLVRQTIEDCLTEAMDAAGFLDVLEGLRQGRIRKLAVDTTEPSAFARGILNAMPYAFLDDAPLEERRTQAVMARRTLDPKTADTLGALDVEAVARVREEAWPLPESAEEVHESLLWMGYVTEGEARECGWSDWLIELYQAGRVVREEVAGPSDRARWHAFESSRDPKTMLRGRLEALGPVVLEASSNPESGRAPLPELPSSEGPLLLELETEGTILRCRIEGRQAWCDRRLLARIHRYTLDRLRREIEAVSAADLWRFLACWQHAAEGHRLDGPRGVATVARQLAGFEIPAAEWEASILPSRVQGYRPEWLDHLTLTGELAWGRLWGAGSSPIRSTPICLLPRDELDLWLGLADPLDDNRAMSWASPPRLVEGGETLSTYARTVLGVLEARGASFAQELQHLSGLLPSHFEMGLGQLIGHGLVTCDSFGGLRRLVTPPSRRRGVMKRIPLVPAGRWSRFRQRPRGMAPSGARSDGDLDTADAARHATPAEFLARRLLERYGVVFRRLLERERFRPPWSELTRVYRQWELAGSVRGGRFVQRFAGEQYALPEAVELMRRLRRGRRARAEEGGERPARAARGLSVAAADPLNLEGILTPEPRVPALARRQVSVG
jgi:ATP-dependent Lhr-like helicase